MKTKDNVEERLEYATLDLKDAKEDLNIIKLQIDNTKENGDLRYNLVRKKEDIEIKIIKLTMEIEVLNWVLEEVKQ